MTALRSHNSQTPSPPTHKHSTSGLLLLLRLHGIKRVCVCLGGGAAPVLLELLVLISLLHVVFQVVVQPFLQALLSHKGLRTLRAAARQ